MPFLKNKKILIIEDEDLFLNFMSEILKNDGFEVLTAKNGEEGLKISIKEKPDLILLDIILPVMDGLAMLKKLREDNYGKDVPVIVLTNLDDVKRVTKAVNLGTEDYLVKNNISTDVILKKVNERLGF